ncbi:MAG: putative oxidoreductase [Candidatus Midichloriaceae bacterium]|jgi:putative oxidoreductase
MCVKKMADRFNCVTGFLEKYVSVIFILACRVHIFWIFFNSGWLKFRNALNGEWYVTEYLFQYEYKTPFISYQLAAILGTFNELFFSSLILIGFASRLSSIALLFMTIVISLTYVYNNEQLIWGLILLNIIIFGPKMISIDHFIKRKFTS